VSWKTVPLGEVCTIVNGGTPKSEVAQYWDGNLNWITPKEMGKLNSREVFTTERKITENGLKNSSAKLLPINSVILSSRAPIGHLAINKELMATNQGCKGLVPSSSLNYEYLYYFLSYSKKLLNDMGSGATFKELSGSKLATVEIPLPPLSTQKKIVSKLDAIFAEIDKASAAAEANAKNAEILFQSHLIQLFNTGNTEFISVPIGEIGEVISGSGFPVDEQGLIDEEVPFYKVSDMNLAGNETYMVSHNNSISKETAKRLGAKIIPSKSVIFPKIGGAIATNKKRILSIPSCVDNNVMGIYPNQKIVTAEFFFHLFSTIELSSLANEAALPSIKKSTVEERLVNIPKSLKEQHSLVLKIDSLKNNTSVLKLGYLKKLSDLNLLKNSILSQAYSGELVKE
jgi:type I restriction enzyme S subunit